MTSKQQIKKLGVLCSGGDSPGMNCVIRSVVRSAIFHGLTPVGIGRGLQGIFDKRFTPLSASDVGNIIQRGGTFLQSSRCKKFFEKEGRAEAARVLREQGIEALVVVGGDGSFNAAHLLHQEHGVPVVGIPGTIDNDIDNTEYTIGFDTAVNTAMEAVDKIRDTASSHARTFLIEVMGRNTGLLALKVGICTGAENIVLPGNTPEYEQIVSDIRRGMARGKTSSVIIVAEGMSPGRSYEIRNTLLKEHRIPTRVCILGHTQRGGSPSPNDCFYGAKMGNLAVAELVQGASHQAIVMQQGRITSTDLSQCLTKVSKTSQEDIRLASQLSI